MKPTILWVGIATGPLAWFASHCANFAFAPLACSGAGKLPLYLVSVAAVTVTVLAGALSFTQWQEPPETEEGAATVGGERRKGMAIAGMGLSCLSLLVILAQAIPNILFGGCE